ncbi:sulfite exporter TauE/SafE family protein [Pedobacter insulae]|uniref:Urease accessory protein UreH-like transmembrane domain-containing protein n=1 Tax=Pedobacter insulae TaxID=414048 RepID=A0A1I3A1B4_9SPHI|nr:sulfite exporter TauE/SafE family protein [Pedobacter insulae]SFH43715.1 hypothetical protein SAMN04489864_11284 [Pedobacter insulae]
MSNLSIAFLLGFLGSMHCAIMCGPLMLSLPLSKNNYLVSAMQLGMYQAGRIVVYTVFGLLAGLIGNSIKLFTNQQTLSLLIGGLMVVFTLIYFTGRYVNQINTLQRKLIEPISTLMGKVHKLRFWGFFAGMLNGLIPCGMVYLALVTSLNSGSITGGASFMLLFGLGTTPLMLAISLGGIYLKRYIRFSPNKMIPWFTLFIGALFILRSVNLGIPFLSPNNQIRSSANVVECR